ncbi:MAG: cell division protein FtsA [Deltaproteobacteria bacterium]|nr:cell division protein FtsA [Deltaproteobacteria bacterium]
MEKNRNSIPEIHSQDSEQLVAALDIGSSKISLSIGTISTGQFNSLSGLIHYQTNGVKSGRIVNVEEVARIISSLLSDARSILGYEVDEVYVGMKDLDFQLHSNNAMVAVEEENGIISEFTLGKLNSAARAIPLGANETIVHVIPMKYLVDGHETPNPLGMKGVRMDVEARVLTVPASVIDDVIRSCSLAGATVSGIIFSPYATHLSVALQRHLLLGCAIIDLGAGSTDITVYRNGHLEYCNVVSAGGNEITARLAREFKCIPSEAEAIKQQFGYAAPFLVENGHEIIPQLSSLGVGDVSWHDVAEVIEDGVRNILVQLLEPLHGAGCELVPPMTVFITGGGAKLNGIRDYLESIMEMKVETGIPTIPVGMFDGARAPQFASSVGTLMHCALGSDFQPFGSFSGAEKPSNKGSFFNKVASLFESFFD